MLNKKIIELQSNNVNQYKKIYYSTKAFDRFLSKKFNNTNSVVDIGCGPGGTLNFYIKKYPKIKFLGIDYDHSNIKFCKLKNKFRNAHFLKYDVLDLKKVSLVKKKLSNKIGIISEKTLLNFDKIENYLNFCFKLNPDWIAINSLFTDFDVNLRVSHEQFEFNKKKINFGKKFNKYSKKLNEINIYSIKYIKNFLIKKNYKLTEIENFYPPKKIPKSKYVHGGGGGSYTINTEFNKNTLFHGPLFLPWKFLLIEKNRN